MVLAIHFHSWLDENEPSVLKLGHNNRNHHRLAECRAGENLNVCIYLFIYYRIYIYILCPR